LTVAVTDGNDSMTILQAVIVYHRIIIILIIVIMMMNNVTYKILIRAGIKYAMSHVRNAFSLFLKVLRDMSVDRRLCGSLFQMMGPLIEKH